MNDQLMKRILGPVYQLKSKPNIPATIDDAYLPERNTLRDNSPRSGRCIRRVGEAHVIVIMNTEWAQAHALKVNGTGQYIYKDRSFTFIGILQPEWRYKLTTPIRGNNLSPCRSNIYIHIRGNNLSPCRSNIYIHIRGNTLLPR